MSIYAIGDLHLPGRGDKPMNVFGAQWERHFETIQENWRACVHDEDIVLIPGDISWAMQLTEALFDIESIAALPGKKVLLRGNHDFWWSSIGKLRSVLPAGMYALQNDSIALDNVVFCGSRGWTLPTEAAPLEPQEQKIFDREVGRVRISLAHAAQNANGRPQVALMHFPPLLADGAETAFSRQLEEAGVTDVVYGHLHGAGIKNGFTGVHHGVRYHLVSCDAIGFSPLLIG
jgi:predicted phosphohydrolase